MIGMTNSFIDILPLGIIIPFYGTKNDLHSYPFLICDGSTFDTDEYPLLYARLGTNVLPDMRELGVVGAGKNETYIFDSTETDPSTQQAGTQEHDVFTIGQFKDEQLKAHHHKVYGRTSGGGNSISNSYPITTHGLIGHASGSLNYTETTSAGSQTKNLISDTGGNVTRGRCMGMNWIIKAR